MKMFINICILLSAFVLISGCGAGNVDKPGVVGGVDSEKSVILIDDNGSDNVVESVNIYSDSDNNADTSKNIVDSGENVVDRGEKIDSDPDSGSDSDTGEIVRSEGEKPITVHGVWEFDNLLEDKYLVEKVPAPVTYEIIKGLVLKYNNQESFDKNTPLAFPSYEELLKLLPVTDDLWPNLILIIGALEYVRDKSLIKNKTEHTKNIYIKAKLKVDQAIDGLTGKTESESIAKALRHLKNASGQLGSQFRTLSSPMDSKNFISTQRCLVRAIGYLADDFK